MSLTGRRIKQYAASRVQKLINTSPRLLNYTFPLLFIIMKMQLDSSSRKLSSSSQR